tara:strand:+ start:191 stop:640 length:450 start_codon:yes stop_codon:yes gene_type:complete
MATSEDRRRLHDEEVLESIKVLTKKLPDIGNCELLLQEIIKRLEVLEKKMETAPVNYSSQRGTYEQGKTLPFSARIGGLTWECVPYKKSIVIVGETKDYKTEIKDFGGQWNARLDTDLIPEGKGWVFPGSKNYGLVEAIKNLPDFENFC